jgi:hypothetical protein
MQLLQPTTPPRQIQDDGFSPALFLAGLFLLLLCCPASKPAPKP